MLLPYRTAVLMVILLAAMNVSATTYYIDYSAGSDSNTGTSKTAAWQHAPGMQGCSANCAAATPQAGDSIILRGGVTWPNQVFPWAWQWSGASGNPIYVGVDQSWYVGSSWARPIFNAGGVAIGGNNAFMNFNSGLSYVTVDNIEWTGMYWSGMPAFGNVIMVNLSTSTNITVENDYFHSWSHDYPSGCNNNCDDLIVVLGNANSPYNVGTVVQNNIFDGSPNGSDSGKATYNIPNIIGNVVQNMSNGLMYTENSTVRDNNVSHINVSYDPGDHENLFECAPCGGTNYIFNNIGHDTATGESLFAGGGSGEVDYVWNNNWWNIGGNPPHIEARDGNWTGYYYNNTVVAPGNDPCFLQAGSGATVTITLENNHCITTGSLDNLTGPTTRVTNVLMTPSTANSQGYTSSEQYAYSPTAQNNGTVGAGTNLNGSCSGTLTNLCSDTTYACTIAAGNVVSCYARTTVPRPQTGAWDAGAYEFDPSDPPPAAPTGLTAAVQ